MIYLKNGETRNLEPTSVALHQTNMHATSSLGRLECSPLGSGAYIQNGLEAHPVVGMLVVLSNWIEYGNYGSGALAPLSYHTEVSEIVSIDPGAYTVMLAGGNAVRHCFDGTEWTTVPMPAPGVTAYRGTAVGWAALSEIAMDGEYSFQPA